MKRIYAVLTVLLAVSLICGSCSQKKDEIRNEEKELTVAISADTGSMDPAGSIALTYLAYSVTALDELLTYDSDGRIEYRAAKSYEVNEDSTIWTFHLREEAVWSDGSPVTSSDFVNTMQRALDPVSQSGYAVYLFPIRNAEAIYNGEKGIEELGVETPDEYTLIFHLESPCVYFLDLLRLPVYTPSCQKYATETGNGWDKDPSTSVSNGPFYLKEYVPEQYFVLEKNERYWNADQIQLNRITYRFFADQQSMANAYEAGEVDVATSLPSYVMELYQGKADLVVTNQIATRYIYPNLDVEPLQDVRVRKALSLAIEREELCKIVGDDTEPTVNLVAKRMKDKATGNYFVEEADPPYADVLCDYEFWQYSSSKPSASTGYTGGLDKNFWYKDTNVKTENLAMSKHAADSITLTWDDAGDAELYRVYRYNEDTKKYAYVATVNDTTYTDTNLQPGTNYQYKVRCVWTIGGNNYYGTYSSALTVPTLPAQVTNVRVDKQTGKTVSLWRGTESFRSLLFSL